MRSLCNATCGAGKGKELCKVDGSTPAGLGLEFTIKYAGVQEVYGRGVVLRSATLAGSQGLYGRSPLTRVNIYFDAYVGGRFNDLQDLHYLANWCRSEDRRLSTQVRR